MPASVTGPSIWRDARSIIAVTANRPLVVSLMLAPGKSAEVESVGIVKEIGCAKDKRRIPERFAQLYLSRHKRSTTLPAAFHDPPQETALFSIDQFRQFAGVEIVRGGRWFVELHTGRLESRDDRLQSTIGLDRMVEQPVQRLG